MLVALQLAYHKASDRTSHLVVILVSSGPRSNPALSETPHWSVSRKPSCGRSPEDWPITIELMEQDASGVIGTVAYPSLDCGGELRPRDVRTDAVELGETITYSGERCLDGGVFVLSVVGSDSLHFSWSAPGSSTVATGTLERNTARASTADVVPGRAQATGGVALDDAPAQVIVDSGQPAAAQGRVSTDTTASGRGICRSHKRKRWWRFRTTQRAAGIWREGWRSVGHLSLRFRGAGQYTTDLWHRG